MGKESFLMVSLEDDKAKKLATVLSNDKCRKILDYFSSHESVTETQIAKDLNLPLSTVHYNIQQLVKANLVKSEEFHYSEKGKEVQHYSLANKYIIISPKPIYGIKQKLRNILPVMLGIIGVAGIIKLFEPFFWRFGSGGLASSAVPGMASRSAPAGAYIAEDAADDMGAGIMADIAEGNEALVLEDGARMLTSEPETQLLAQDLLHEPYLTGDFGSQSVFTLNDILIWFVAGAMLAMTVYVIVDYIVYKKKN